jgi:hypothetical protein
MTDQTYHRRVLKIRAQDSPNVRRGLILKERHPDWSLDKIDEHSRLVPGVLTYAEYVTRRATWDKVRQAVGLDAEFWEGAELLLFPPDWLTRVAQPEFISRCLRSPTESIGIDPAEGGDKTSMAAINRWGLKELVSRQTPNTAAITGEVIAFVRKHGVPWSKVAFDRGGGGKQHADRLVEQGYRGVRTVAFGEAPQLELKRGLYQMEVRKDTKQEAYAYVNLRAQMYHELSQLIDPAGWTEGFPDVMASIEDLGYTIPDAPQLPLPGETEEEFTRRKARLAGQKLKANAGFAMPDQDEPYAELRRQLAVMPKLTDEEGRYWMLPKQLKTGKVQSSAKDRIKTLVEIIGHSPDEADAVVLAVHALLHKGHRSVAGAVR